MVPEYLLDLTYVYILTQTISKINHIKIVFTCESDLVMRTEATLALFVYVAWKCTQHRMDSKSRQGTQ